MAAAMIALTGVRRFLIRMGLFLGLVAALCALLFDVLAAAFAHNPALNGSILAALLIGIVFIFRQVLMLRPEIEWLDAYQRKAAGVSPALSSTSLSLLAPMAAMMGDKGRERRFTLSTLATRSMLDSIGTRLDEGRDIARYLIGLLVLLGLLGTFWGLIQTVGSVGDVVGRITLTGNDPVAAFDDLKRGLSTPLSAMGTAFSSSLFGLAGSLILGFLDLQAGQAQNRFYNELEEWLSGLTRIGSGAGPASDAGETSVPAYIQALLEQTADSLDTLQRIIAKGEEGRQQTNQSLTALADRLTTLSDQMRAEQNLLVKLAEGQMEMRPVLTRLADRLDAGSTDEAARTHLRNLETQLARLVEELRSGRGELVNEMRSEFRLLARTIAAMADEDAR